MSAKHYADRDVIAQGDFYIAHVDAMTREGLHSKSDIAAELAHRDAEISRLAAEILALKAILEEVQYMSVGCDCADCYSLRMRLAERAANLLGLRDLPARSEGA